VLGLVHDRRQLGHFNPQPVGYVSPLCVCGFGGLGERRTAKGGDDPAATLHLSGMGADSEHEVNTHSGPEPDTAAEVHGTVRHDNGYNIMEMVSEYRALRARIIKLWTNQNRLLPKRTAREGETHQPFQGGRA
jgi:hypothetical protein